MDDLNDYKIPSADGSDILLTNFSISEGEVDVVFRNIRTRLIQEIKQSHAVLGCVAWLTDLDILSAFENTQTCLVVQKEDFLRPDLGLENKQWKEKLRESYDKLKCNFERYALPGIASSLSTGGDPLVHAIRCVGNHNSKCLAFFSSDFLI